MFDNRQASTARLPKYGVIVETPLLGRDGERAMRNRRHPKTVLLNWFIGRSGPAL